MEKLNNYLINKQIQMLYSPINNAYAHMQYLCIENTDEWIIKMAKTDWQIFIYYFYILYRDHLFYYQHIAHWFNIFSSH